MATEATGQVCSTCGSKLVAEKPPPGQAAKALGTLIVIVVVVFLSGFVRQAVQWSWGL